MIAKLIQRGRVLDEPKPIGDIIPRVLARYGISTEPRHTGAEFKGMLAGEMEGAFEALGVLHQSWKKVNGRNCKDDNPYDSEQAEAREYERGVNLLESELRANQKLWLAVFKWQSRHVSMRKFHHELVTKIGEVLEATKHQKELF